MPNVIALIPARGGSKSIPLKNIKLLANKPLIYWNLQAASSCSLVNEVHVATDNKQIKETALSFNLPKVKIFNRKIENAQDTSSTESVLLEFLAAKNLHEDDLIILMQVTSPFTTQNHLTEALMQLKNEKADSLLSAVDFKRFIWNKHGVSLNYNYTSRPRRQDFSGYYLENGAFYISNVKNILQNKNRISGVISLYLMPNHTALELDEPEDWPLAEALIKNTIPIK